MKHKPPYLTLTLIVLTVLLTAASGLLSSAISLSGPLKSFAPLLFLGITLILCAIAVVQYLREEQPVARQSHKGNQSSTHDRQVFLDWLSIYYTERLKESFEGAAPIVPDLALKTLYQNTPNLSGNHQQMHYQPAGTTIIQIYDKKETRGDLLILGEAGSGKTTLLLTLAVALHTRAESAPRAPIPVIVSLSTWTRKTRSFGEWFVRETSRCYNMPPKLLQSWLEANQILPLLDGLDEVSSSCYDSCVKAINDFRQESSSFIPLVVCSRYEGDFEQVQHLALQNAVIILPLEERQIQEYCKAAGLDWALQNAELRELVKLPLMLHILALTHQNSSIRSLPRQDDPEKLRRELFDRYMQRMLVPQPRSVLWSVTQIKDWLAWIAWHVQKENKSHFTLEDFTSSWLPQIPRRLYLVIVYLVSLPIAALIIVLIFRPGAAWLHDLAASRHVCTNLSCFQQEDVVGNFFKGIARVILDWLSNSVIATVFGIICVMALGFFLTDTYSKVAVDFTVSWKKLLWRPFQRLLLSIGYNWQLRHRDGLLDSIYNIIGMIIFLGLLGWIIGSAFAVSPIWHVVIALLIALLFPTLFTCGIFLFSLLLRFFYWRSGCLPWKVEHFLDENVQRLLLYKENKRYRFIHNLFRDYLAFREDRSVKKSSSP